MTADIATVLKRRTEALVKSLGVERSCAIIGKSKATIGRYYSLDEEHADRFMPIDAVALLEAEAGLPLVTDALIAHALGPEVADLSDLSEGVARLMSGDLPVDQALAEARILQAALTAHILRLTQSG